ncbi:hypothetical protein BDW22DRAFT_1354744 [Trametopsis cervina]|nr:hypothetical protein BDW22DRAFT_1354744 [Trametopsis cervina]
MSQSPPYPPVPFVEPGFISPPPLQHAQNHPPYGLHAQSQQGQLWPTTPSPEYSQLPSGLMVLAASSFPGGCMPNPTNQSMLYAQNEPAQQPPYIPVASPPTPHPTTHPPIYHAEPESSTASHFNGNGEQYPVYGGLWSTGPTFAHDVIQQGGGESHSPPSLEGSSQHDRAYPYQTQAGQSAQAHKPAPVPKPRPPVQHPAPPVQYPAPRTRGPEPPSRHWTT